MTKEETEAGVSASTPIETSDFKMEEVQPSDRTQESDSKESVQLTSPVTTCDPNAKENVVEGTKENASNSSEDELPALLDFDWREKSTVSENKSQSDATGPAASNKFLFLKSQLCIKGKQLTPHWE